MFSGRSVLLKSI